ncbi:hypothetical protein Lesp02_84940 [Lentzea sp. NBRC 105346]|uniref:TolB family protein n=1 Tax=Lentzea sp. NBRC 105346 TaxID=3032205 RepID=UPI0024A507D5|nr:hypothetical protein [Lentzea sp. NBRC 105346]GLZ36307.1 hypothetical protein Lesp02_84940 [Lentzea sp. NBRC 105346]
MRIPKTTACAAVVVLLTAAVPAAAQEKQHQGLVRVTVGYDGKPANAGSERVSISGDGRFVIFTSRATNLVKGVTSGVNHVYLRDLARRTTSVVDVNDADTPADQHSWEASITPDGRFVTFFSDATNLAGQANGRSHIYVRDLLRRKTSIVDVSPSGDPSNQDSIQSQISPDGTGVVFMSRGTNLVPGDVHDTWNVFYRDLRTSTTQLVSRGHDGKPANGVSYGPSISADRRYVSFASLGDNLIPGDTNKAGDVFVRDLRTGTNTIVSVGNGDVRGDDLAVGSSISADGRYVGFSSHATNIAPGLPKDHSSHSYVRDTKTGTTIALDTNASGAVGNGGATWTGLSPSGRYATFQSFATNLVDGVPTAKWNIYRRDLRTGAVQLVSSTAGKSQSNGENWWPTSSANDRVAGFLSFGDDVLPGDTNGVSDVYVRYLGEPEKTVTPAQTASAPAAANRNQTLSSQARNTISPNGKPGDIVASGSSFVVVPYLNYFASFNQTTSKVAWLGTSPVVADSIQHTDSWHVDYFGGPYEAKGAPQGAQITGDTGSLDVAWSTTANQTWYSEHKWDRVDIAPPSWFGQIYRIKHTVTGTFQFGSSFYTVQADGRAFVW